MELHSSQLDPVSVIHISGEFKPGDDDTFARGLMTEINKVVASGIKRILVDLDIDFLNSFCLGTLLAQDRKVQSTGGRFAMYTYRPRLRALFLVLKCVGGVLFLNREEALCYVVYGTGLNVARDDAQGTEVPPSMPT